jgi:hypothetical protein
MRASGCLKGCLTTGLWSIKPLYLLAENNTAAFFTFSSPSFTRLIYPGDADCTHRVQRSVRDGQKFRKSGVVSTVD